MVDNGKTRCCELMKILRGCAQVGHITISCIIKIQAAITAYFIVCSQSSPAERKSHLFSGSMTSSRQASKSELSLHESAV